MGVEDSYGCMYQLLPPCMGVPPQCLQSMGHRSLICGALPAAVLSPTSSWSADITATVDALSAAGFSLKKGKTQLLLPVFSAKEPVIDCNESAPPCAFSFPWPPLLAFLYPLPAGAGFPAGHRCLTVLSPSWSPLFFRQPPPFPQRQAVPGEISSARQHQLPVYLRSALRPAPAFGTAKLS